MKRNTFWASTAMLMILVLTDCSNEVKEAIIEQQNTPKEITITASAGTDTRTYVHNDNGTYKTFWMGDENIYVWGYEASDAEESSFPPYVFGKLYMDYGYYDSDGNFEGSTEYNYENIDYTKKRFKGFLWGEGTKSDLKYALYPEPQSSSQDHKTFYYTLKSSYKCECNQNDYSSDLTYVTNNAYTVISNAPMGYIATTTDGAFNNTIKFEQLCGMIRVELNNVSSMLNVVTTDETKTVTVRVMADTDIAGTTKVTLSKGADNKSSFNLEMENGIPSMYSSVEFIGIKPNDINNYGNSLMLDLPVPANKSIKYIISMTYPTYSINSDGSYDGNNVVMATSILFQGTRNIGKGQLWIPLIDKTTITTETGGFTNTNSGSN